MRQKFMMFMQGRYGADELSRFLSVSVIVLWILSIFIRIPARHSFIFGSIYSFITLLVWVFAIIMIYRMFSKNIQKRYQENQKFLLFKNKFMQNIKRAKTDKNHRIFSCPNCKQKIRVPKHKGKIAIRCPKCNNEFIKRT